ncbi:MAG: hypothetical protein PHC75_04770 [Burkholderiales bacterium]|nr:hypothetical protein [Burkholderiales bacterium]
MQNHKQLVVAIISLLLIACNQVGNSNSSSNTLLDVALKSDIYDITPSNLMNGNYRLGQLEDDLIRDICAGFGYDAEKKECHHTIETPKVENIKNLADINPEFDLRNNPVTKNKAGVTSIDYVSKINFYNDKTSYLIMYPKMKDVSKFKGVIVYFHPTLFDKQWAPSVNTDGHADREYAAIFASQGYVVILPDYQGMGKNWQEIHPYVIVPDIIINEVKQILTSERSTIISDYKTGSDGIPLFAVGFSEGAGYAVNFAKDSIYSSVYNLKAVIGLDGAYDLSGTTYDYLTSNVSAPDACAIDNNSKFKSQYQMYVNLTKPALMSLVMPTYNQYVAQENLSYGFNDEFYKMAKCSHLTKDCVFDAQPNIVSIGDALRKFSIGNSDYLEKVASAAIGTGLYLVNGNTLALTVEHLLTSHQNSLTDHANSHEGVFNMNVINNDDFKNALKKADAYRFTPQTNVALVSLKYDSIVTPKNTDVAYESFTTVNKSKNFSVGLSIIDNKLFHSNLVVGSDKWKPYIPDFKSCYNRLDHPQAEPFLGVIALKYIESVGVAKKPVETYIERKANPIGGKCSAKYNFELTGGNSHSILFDGKKQSQCENMDISSCFIQTEFPTSKNSHESYKLSIDGKNYEILYMCKPQF